MISHIIMRTVHMQKNIRTSFRDTQAFDFSDVAKATRDDIQLTNYINKQHIKDQGVPCAPLSEMEAVKMKNMACMRSIK